MSHFSRIFQVLNSSQHRYMLYILLLLLGILQLGIVGSFPIMLFLPFGVSRNPVCGDVHNDLFFFGGVDTDCVLQCQR